MDIEIEEIAGRIYQEWGKNEVVDDIESMGVYFTDKNNGIDGMYVYKAKIIMFNIDIVQAGKVQKRKITDNEFEIVFWILRELALAKAIKMAEEDEINSEDLESYVASKQLEILNKIDEKYAVVERIEREYADEFNAL